LQRADPEIEGDDFPDFPFAFFRQNAGEKTPALLALESIFS
jgi:hypothetical protein